MRSPRLSELSTPPSGKTGWPWTEESPQLPDTMPDGSPWPKVSIVTPSYNQGQFIEETVLSVKAQNYPRLEHIVIDGGSTDGTLDVLRRYERDYDLRWVSEPDNGQSDAVNKGFRLAGGEVVGWLNSDDVYLPRAVSTAVRHLMSCPGHEWVYGDGYSTDKRGRVLCILKSSILSIEDLLCRNMLIVQPSMFFRRRVLDRVGMLDVSMHTAMDLDFCLRLWLESTPRYIRAPLATRRIHREAKSIARSTEFYVDAVAAFDKFFANQNLPETVLRVRRRAYSHCYRIGGVRAFTAGQLSEAHRLLRKALSLYPRLWDRRTWLILLLMLESWLGVRWIAPGRSRRKAEKRFRARYGDVFANWQAGEK